MAGEITTGLTPGRVAHLKIAGQNLRFYDKPSLAGLRKVSKYRKGKPVKAFILRRSGVNRVSEDVIKINEQLAAYKDKPDHPSVKCAGLHGMERFECLQREMDAIISPVT